MNLLWLKPKWKRDYMHDIIEKYISNNNQEFQRYNSWNHCFKAFAEIEDEKQLSLHLGFYLASWGMYRGSSGLLQKDYLVHLEAVRIIKRFWHLRCTKENEVDQSAIPEIVKVIKELKNHYNSLKFQTLKGVTKTISPTDTLISKILLGSLGCLPAFDRFFVDGVTQEKEKFKTLKESSLEMLFDYVDKNKELALIQKQYPAYPKMKLVDMYFWQIGFDESRKKN